MTSNTINEVASVWLAEDTQLDNKPFAIKMLPSILVSNKRAYSQPKALVEMEDVPMIRLVSTARASEKG